MRSDSHAKMMDKYELLTQLGDGTFGCVIKAICKKTGQLVAIKKMKQKFYTWEECVKLPEVEVVRRIHSHPNIVKLREVVRENNELFLVLEFMDGDLLGVIRKAKQVQNAATSTNGPALGYPKIKSYMFQILQSLAYLHRKGYFHRDMKPENLLIKKDPTSSPQEVVKLGDFGLAKEIRARPPFTDYVSTRWYRSPELLLQDRVYGPPVDIWAAGCILAELITTRPLFAGSNEVDQLQKIMSVLGSPNEHTWSEGIALARRIRYTFPNVKGIGLERALPPHLPPQTLDLMKQMLTYDPKKRPSAQQCLQHPYFSVGLDGENIAPLNVAKQLANAAKQYALGPQSAPAGSLATDAAILNRPSIVATTAIPKAIEVSNSAIPGLSQNPPPPAPSILFNECALLDKKPHEVSPAMAFKSTPAQTPIPIPSPKLADALPSLPKNKNGGTSTNKLPTPSKTTTENSDALMDKLDLESVINDFSSELKTLGLFAQQKQQGATPAVDMVQKGLAGSPKGKKLSVVSGTFEKMSSDKPDLIATLLNSTRYKRSSFDKSIDKVCPSLPTQNPFINRMDSKLTHAPTAVARPTVSPSVQALLAKHKKEGLSNVLK